MQKHNWKGKLLAVVMAMAVTFTGTSASMLAFADNASAAGGTGDNFDISKMHPTVTMEYQIDGSWKSQLWVDSHYTDEYSGVPSGTAVRFKIQFKPDSSYEYKTGDKLYYTPMSKLLKITTASGTMKDGLDVAGAWNVGKTTDDNYRLDVALDSTYISRTPNLSSGYVMLNGTLNYTPGDSHTMTIPFPGADSIKVPIAKKKVNPVSLDITKSKGDKGIYKGSDGNYYIDYSIKVSNSGDVDATGVKVVDSPAMKDSSTSDSKYTPTKPSGSDDVFYRDSNGKEAIDNISGGTLTKQDGQWIWNVGTVAAKSSKTLSFRMRLTNEVSLRDVKIYNGAAVFYNDNFVKSHYVSASTTAGLSSVSKDAGVYHKVGNEGVVTYTVKVSPKSANISNLSNVTVRDYIKDKNLKNLLKYERLQVKVGGKSYTVGAPSGSPRKWALTSDTGISQGYITEGTDSEGRMYCEFTIKTLKPGEKIEFTYDLVVDDALFSDSQGPASSAKSGDQVSITTTKEIGNVAGAYLNGERKVYKDKTVKISKGWLKKNGTKRENGFWMFNLRVNSPAEGTPCFATADTINSIADRLGEGWVYCGSDKSTEGANAVVTVKKYPIINGGTSYDATKGTTIKVPLSDIVSQLKSSDAASGNGKYTSMWGWQDKGAYYYEITYYAKRVDTNVSDELDNSAGYDTGIGWGSADIRKPFNHEVEWFGTDTDDTIISKEGTGFNTARTEASWKIKIAHNVYNGWKVIDRQASGSKGFTIKPETVKVGILSGSIVTPLAADRYTVSPQTGEITFNGDVAASAAAPIVITYDTALNQNDIDKVAGGQQVKYVNEAILRGSDTNEAGATADQSFTKPDYISKKVVGNVTNGIVTWEVKINATGDMAGDAVVTDMIPAGHQFVQEANKSVAESITVSKGSAASGTSMDSATLTQNDGQSVLTMNISGLNRTGGTDAYVAMQFKTKIVDPNFTMANVKNVKYENKAYLDYDGVRRSAQAFVQASNEALTKKDAFSGQECDYTIGINNNAVDMNPIGDTVKVIDECSKNMMVETNTIVVEKYENNSWVKLDPQPAVGISGQQMTVEVPDNMKLRIRYTCFIFGNDREQVEFNNSVKFEGTGTTVSVPSIEVLQYGEGGLDGVPNVKIKKLDGSDVTKTIQGVQFKLYEVTAGTDGIVTTQVGDPVVTDDTGYAIFKNLDKSKVYAFREAQTKQEYILDSSMIYFYFDDDAVTNAIKAAADAEGIELRNVIKGFTFEISNVPRTLQVSKVDFDNTATALPGAHIKVIGPDSKVFDEWDTNGQIHDVTHLKANVLYTIKESKVPEGYQKVNDITFMMNEDGTINTQQGTINTEAVTSEVADGVLVLKDIPLTKVEAEKIWNDTELSKLSDKGYSRPESITYNMYGAIAGEDGDIQVYPDKTGAKATKTVTANDNWKATFNDLPKYDSETGKAITYYVYESDTPGYSSSNSADNPVNATENGNKAAITNTPGEDVDFIPVDLTVKKTDSKDKTKKLEGASFKVEKGGKIVGTEQATGEDGTTTFTFREPGTYTVTETKAPDGYLLGSDEYIVKVEQGEISEVKKSDKNIFVKIFKMFFGKNELAQFKDGVLTVENEPTEIGVLKVDQDDNSVILTGAHLSILDEEYKLVEEWDSDQTPHQVTNLEIGKTYYLKEVTPPDGYALTTITKFVIDEDSNIIKDPEKTTEGTVNKDGVLLNIDPMIAENTGIQVTKHLKKSNGDSLGATDRTFYVALFSDEELTDRVSDVKPMRFVNSSSETVTFDKVSADRTYYVAEVDANGKALTEPQNPAPDELYVMDFGDGDVSKKVVTEEDQAPVYFENEYWGIPEGFYKDGSIEITKKVTDAEGNPINVTESFWVTAFTDEECTNAAYGPVEIKLNEESTGKAVIEEMALGTYFLAETDSTGAVVDETFDYVPVFDTSKVVIDTEKTEFAVNLTNKQPVEAFSLVKLVKDSKGKAMNYKGSFYVTVFNDEECTDIVRTEKISMNKASKATITIGGLDPGAYWLAETDKDGNPVDKKFNFTAKFDRSKINIVRAELTEDVTLTNTEKPSGIEGFVKTGDNMNIILAGLIMFIAFMMGCITLLVNMLTSRR